MQQSFYPTHREPGAPNQPVPLVLGNAHLVSLVLVACSLVFAVAGCSSTAKRPAIFLSPEFHWSANAPLETVAMPTTGRNPGPTIRLRMHHQSGFGMPLQAPDLHAAAVANGSRVFSVETDHLNGVGWQPLFSPTAIGSFPQYAVYMAFQSGKYYCFIVYSAARLDQAQGTQELSVYYS